MERIIFIRTSKNTYRRFIDGAGTKEVYHAIKQIPYSKFEVWDARKQN